MMLVRKGLYTHNNKTPLWVRLLCTVRGLISSITNPKKYWMNKLSQRDIPACVKNLKKGDLLRLTESSGTPRKVIEGHGLTRKVVRPVHKERGYASWCIDLEVIHNLEDKVNAIAQLTVLQKGIRCEETKTGFRAYPSYPNKETYLNYEILRK